MTIEPQQFSRIERRRYDDVFGVKQRYHFVARKYFLMTLRPLQMNQIIHLRLRQKTLIAIIHNIFGKRSKNVVSDLNIPEMLLKEFENLWAVKEDKKKTVAAHTCLKPSWNGQEK